MDKSVIIITRHIISYYSLHFFLSFINFFRPCSILLTGETDNAIDNNKSTVIEEQFILCNMSSLEDNKHSRNIYINIQSGRRMYLQLINNLVS